MRCLTRLRCALRLLGRSPRVGELMKINADSFKKADDGVPAHAAMAVLKLGQIRGAYASAGTQLLLRKSGLGAQLAQRGAEELVIPDRGVGWRVTDHCNLSKVTLRSARHYKWRPRCIHTRAPGTRSANSRHAGHATNRWCLASLPEPFSRSLQSRRNRWAPTRTTSGRSEPCCSIC